MRVDLTYDCGCFLTVDLEPCTTMPDGQLRACHLHGRPAAKAGHPARRLLSIIYDEDGGGDG